MNDTWPLLKPHRSGEIALADLLDRALNKGVVLWGEATISVASVDLIYLGVKLLVSSIETAERMRTAATGQGRG
ncbi:MAG: GvpA-family gas vesicle protein [Rhodospirillaceae bacterium]|nr:MAG: GvpA-family gas vesicle protein [Rhodospirillaceae bacterium]